MIPASVRFFVCTRPHDMRCSYETLALATQKVLGQDPRSGALFVFTNKRHNRLKVLWWDRNESRRGWPDGCPRGGGAPGATYGMVAGAQAEDTTATAVVGALGSTDGMVAEAQAEVDTVATAVVSATAQGRDASV